MSAESIKAVADLLWPVLACVLAFKLLPVLVSVIQSRNVRIKLGDIELSVQDAADQLRRQVEDLQDQVKALPETEAVASPRTMVREIELHPARPSILWVDDKPSNNAYEIAKLEADGCEVAAVVSTAEALKALDSRATPPTAIISDMGRKEGLSDNPRAGLDLIKKIRAMSIKTPIYIYTSSNYVDVYRSSVEQHGGDGITASPIELFRMIASS